MGNEKECVCSAPNCCDTERRSGKIIKEMPGSVASGTHYTISIPFRVYYSTDSCGVLLTVLLSRSVCLHSLFVSFLFFFPFCPFSLLFV